MALGQPPQAPWYLRVSREPWRLSSSTSPPSKRRLGRMCSSKIASMAWRAGSFSWALGELVEPGARSGKLGSCSGSRSSRIKRSCSSRLSQATEPSWLLAKAGVLPIDIKSLFGFQVLNENLESQVLKQPLHLQRIQFGD